MDPNCMIEASCYTCLEEIGKGAHGTVWKAVDQVTGRVCAIKRMNGRFSQYENYSGHLAEVKCLQKLGPHENIVALHDAILDGSTLYLVLEFMECDLLELMRTRGRSRPFSEQEVRNFLFQILKGLLHMHGQGYCHRDLKPQNLLVTGDIVKIADFGLAKNLLHDFNYEPLQSYVVTRPYRAPELFLGSTHYDFAIDIWAMGVIMAELFTGYPLFSGSNMVDSMDNICSVIGSPDNQTWLQGLVLAASLDYKFPEKFMKVSSIRQLFSLIPTASSPAIDLINSFLSWNPKRRPTAIEALQHPFFYVIPRLFLLHPSQALAHDRAQNQLDKPYWVYQCPGSLSLVSQDQIFTTTFSGYPVFACSSCFKWSCKRALLSSFFGRYSGFLNFGMAI